MSETQILSINKGKIKERKTKKNKDKMEKYKTLYIHNSFRKYPI